MLQPMTRALAHQFFRDFSNDPDVFADNQPYVPYSYSPERCDAYFEKQRNLGRIHLAILLAGQPIGEIILKDLDPRERSCALSIHLQNDTVKNHGHGTEAERQALRYAFETLKMKTVTANALIKNERSRHVLEKVGFHETHRDSTFCYYQYTAYAGRHTDGGLNRPG